MNEKRQIPLDEFLRMLFAVGLIGENMRPLHESIEMLNLLEALTRKAWNLQTDQLHKLIDLVGSHPDRVV